MYTAGSQPSHRQVPHAQPMPRVVTGRPAHTATSPQPPLHQVLRQARALLNEEKVRMSLSPVGSPERRRRKRNVACIKAYERRFERARSRTLDLERREMDAATRRAAAEAAPYWARHKRVDRDIAAVRGRIGGLETRQAALKLRIRTLGAQAKGDAHPVRFADNGMARFDKAITSLPGRVLGFFRRSHDVARLTEPEARERLGRIHAELDRCAQELLRLEGEKGRIGYPVEVAVHYPLATLPTREYILRTVHSNQPLRRNQPFVDVPEAAAQPQRSPASPTSPVRSILKDPSQPPSPVSPGGRQVRFDDEAVPFMAGYPSPHAELPAPAVFELPAAIPELPAWPEGPPVPQAYTYRHSMPSSHSPGPAYPDRPVIRKPLPAQAIPQSADSLMEQGFAPQGNLADSLPRHPSGRLRPAGPRLPPWETHAPLAPTGPIAPAAREAVDTPESPVRDTAWPPPGHKAGWRPMHWDHAQEDAIRNPGRRGFGES